MRRVLVISTLLAVSVSADLPAAPSGPDQDFYLPDATASRLLTVGSVGPARASVVVLTEGVAVKETGPRETVRAFGEVYAFAPAFFAVYRDEPTEVVFWNLQADDEHDVMFFAPDWTALLKQRLAPLKKTTFVMTFHREGIYRFYCTVHMPEMAGSVLVLPPGR